ncbi:MAG: diguanylate cyclase [Campylobacterota bacterium]|nr:diguanylate cyclase [Campylobacterota bacterium]
MFKLSIELKMVIGVVIFTFFIVGIERYQLSKSMMTQFIESKKAKNRLLIDTITPIISLNLSLGLKEANHEYLNQIAKQNSDLSLIHLLNSNQKLIYAYNPLKIDLKFEENSFTFIQKDIIDTITNETLGTISLNFLDDDYQSMINKNRALTLQIFVITLFLLSIFVLLIKREFRDLKKLSNNVTIYDPKKNNFTLERSERVDEVGIIHNAIISMVSRIHSHAELLDDLNQSLEEKVQERTKELENANIKLELLSSIDQLTQLSNRRHFQKYIEERWELAKRKNVEIAIIMTDIDHFKQINDTYGHVAGDIVLKEIAKTMKNTLKRTTDFIARYGGEEFIIVLYDTDMNQAHETSLSIQKAINSIKNFESDGTLIRPVTMSFGISSSFPHQNEKYENLIKEADAALYQAKEQGRDRIIVAKAA